MQLLCIKICDLLNKCFISSCIIRHIFLYATWKCILKYVNYILNEKYCENIWSNKQLLQFIMVGFCRVLFPPLFVRPHFNYDDKMEVLENPCPFSFVHINQIRASSHPPNKHNHFWPIQRHTASKFPGNVQAGSSHSGLCDGLVVLRPPCVCASQDSWHWLCRRQTETH